MEKEEEENRNPPESGRTGEWSDLTPECLANILGRLAVEHLWMGPMLTCKSWLQVSVDPTLHRSFDLDPLFASRPDSPRLWSPDFERKVDSMLRSVVLWSHGGLRVIRTSHCSDHSLSFAATRCPKLEVLSIKSSPNVLDTSIVAMAINCPLLREVDISFCYNITAGAIELVGTHCPNLKTFRRNLMNWLDPSQHVGIVPDEYLNDYPQDGDSEAGAIAKCMPQLEHLEIQFSKISGKGLVLISESCLNLVHLDLFGCANLTGRDITNALTTLKNLKKMKRPNFYIPRSIFHSERYGHWRLYDERFQTDVFRI